MKAENIRCPVCGYYCSGKGGHGCIDKPALFAAEKLLLQKKVEAGKISELEFKKGDRVLVRFNESSDGPEKRYFSHYNPSSVTPYYVS